MPEEEEKQNLTTAKVYILGQKKKKKKHAMWLSTSNKLVHALKQDIQLLT